MVELISFIDFLLNFHIIVLFLYLQAKRALAHPLVFSHTNLRVSTIAMCRGRLKTFKKLFCLEWEMTGRTV
jgi:hypothetical protein